MAKLEELKLSKKKNGRAFTNPVLVNVNNAGIDTPV